MKCFCYICMCIIAIAYLTLYLIKLNWCDLPAHEVTVLTSIDVLNKLLLRETQYVYFT